MFKNIEIFIVITMIIINEKMIDNDASIIIINITMIIINTDILIIKGTLSRPANFLYVQALVLVISETYFLSWLDLL